MVERGVGAAVAALPEVVARPAEPAPTPAIEAEIVEGRAALRALRADWVRLSSLPRGGTVFQTIEVVETWLDAMPAGAAKGFAAVVLRAEGRVVALWPLRNARAGLATVARGAAAPFAQYDDWLVDPLAPADRCFEAAKAALLRRGVDLVALTRVPETSALDALLGRDGIVSGEAEAAVHADLDPPALTEFMASRKSSMLRNHRRKARNFEGLGKVGFEIAGDAATARAWLDEVLAMKRRWLCATGRVSGAFMRPSTVRVMHLLAERFPAEGGNMSVVLARLSLDGRTAAIEMGLVHRGAFHYYIGAYDEALAAAGPGILLTERVIRWCGEVGLTRYDMLAPKARYKEEWGTGERRVTDYALPLTRTGRLHVRYVENGLSETLRRGFYALPLPVRSALAARVLRLA